MSLRQKATVETQADAALLRIYQYTYSIHVDSIAFMWCCTSITFVGDRPSAPSQG